MTMVIAVMGIWKHKGYKVNQSFLSIKNNNDIAFHVDYLILQLQEAKPNHPCSLTPRWQYDGKDLVVRITCVGH